MVDIGTLCVQIVPAPDSYPEWGTIVQRPDEAGREMECRLCSGTGMISHGEACRKCLGRGKQRFALALRLQIPPGPYLGLNKQKAKEAADFVEQLADHHRIDRTIHLVERGAGRTNTGEATIVCGLRGEQLPAVAGHATCGGAHAVFWVHAAMVISYTQYGGQGFGAVSLIAVDRRASQQIGVQSVDLWRFVDGEEDLEVLAPEFLRHNWLGHKATLEFPVAAVEAARRKARMYHCRSAVYADGQYASGPTGALRGAGAACGGIPSPHKGPGAGYELEW